MTDCQAFTTTYNGRSNVLQGDVEVMPGFDPQGGEAHPAGSVFRATWDTGATHSAISGRVVQELGLQPIGRTKVHTAAGQTDTETYVVNFSLPNKVGIALAIVTKCDLAGCDVLIGMDVIGMGDFAVSNFDGETVFTFRTPSAERIDFVRQMPLGTVAASKPGRNEPCPCGSGKKYKKCHGAARSAPSKKR